MKLSPDFKIDNKVNFLLRSFGPVIPTDDLQELDLSPEPSSKIYNSEVWEPISESPQIDL